MKTILKCFRTHLIIRNYAKKANTLLIDSEMKYLNVAEKHDAAKTIAGLLSNGSARRREGYSVYNKIFDFDASVNGRQSKMIMTSVSGHLLHLEFLMSYRNWRNVDPQTLFEAPVRKACSSDYEPIKRTLEREIRNCGGLIIWTDCDREGENIGFEIIDVCRAIKPNLVIHRAIFSEITSRAVKRALQQLATPDKRQSEAVDIRTELDLRTGAAITRFQTMRLQRLFPEKIADKLISYGSCQIPTLGFVAERYKEIEAFVSEPFWKIKVTHTIDDLTVDFNWARNRLFDKQACEDYFLLCLADPKATVESVTVKPKSKWRPTPMDTVEMEKLGSRKLKLSAKETMTIAEKLYTRGIISYPRTETNQFSKEFDLSSLVEQQTEHNVWGEFAKRVKEWGPNPRNGNKSDQAHPPIHPTKLVTNLSGDEARVYELVCRHFLACISKDAIGSETVVNINIAGEKFTATGLCIFERNYLDVYIYDKWNAKQIHKYEEGQVFDPTDITMPEGATTAPPLLTEADLIALMEKHGIGTDATHAEHINTIKERGYIGVVDKGCLIPGVIGMGLYEGYDAMELALAKPMLRAEFEADLKKICLGEKNPKLVLADQIQKYKQSYRQIMDKVTAMDEKMGQRINETPAANNNNFENAANQSQALMKCPKCNIAPLSLRPKKNQSGHFIGCMNYPDCQNAIWLPEECKEYTVLNENCQQCGDGVKLLKFKFQTSYHKSLFNAPFGWYKTCLRCDHKFRDTFNIDLDKVKKTGGIVGDITNNNNNNNNRTDSSTNNRSNADGFSSLFRGMSGSGPSTGSSGPSTGSSGPSTGSNNNNKKRKQKKRKDDSDDDNDGGAGGAVATTTTTKTKRVKKSATKTIVNNNVGGIRSYFTASSTTVTAANTISLADEVAAELNDVPLDEFFGNDDDFDEIILATDTNITNQQNNNTNRSPLERQPAIETDVAITFDDDDDDDLISWGTGDNNNCHSNNNTNRNTSSTAEYGNNLSNSKETPNSNAVVLDESFSSFFQNDVDLDNYVWGSAAKRQQENQQSKNRQNSATTNERTRYSIETTATNRNSTNQWGSGSVQRTTEDCWGTEEHRSLEIQQEHNVKCTGCHQIAKELTVKKEGPNKGRQFYACPKPKACKFFQWADEVATTTTTTTTATTSPQTNNQNSWGEARSSTYKSGNNNATSTTWGTSGDNQTFETNDEDSIKCNCGNAAKSLTVRKDGPNKGRPFYACANRDGSCGFFKWGDEDEQLNRARDQNDGGASTSWGSNGKNNNTKNFTAPNNKNTNNRNGNNQREDKKRKCGLCRQEGHTKAKCPRKAEFEF